jgi:hypothetical protein
MKNRLFLLLVIIAMVGITITFNYGAVWAQRDEEGGKGPIRTEFSNVPDRKAVPGGGSIDGRKPMQGLYTEPIDVAGPPNPQNAIFYRDADTINGQIDALANIGDLYFGKLIADQAVLLVSFQVDPGGNAVWYETPAPVTRGVKWTQAQLNNPNTPPDTQLTDLDALQLWGADIGWGNAYSILGDPPVGAPPVRYSVFLWWDQRPGPPAHSIGYVPRADIVAAVRALGFPASDTGLVDLDGLMVMDTGGDFDSVWNTGDTIIFSIRATGSAPPHWDGGEIVVLPFGGPPTFLNHGGHLWNTAFICSTAFGVHTEEVDAIEAFVDTITVTQISISGTENAWVILPPPPIRVNTGQTLRIWNDLLIIIKVKIWNRDGSIAEYTIPPGGYVDHLVQKAVIPCELKVFKLSGQELVEGMFAQCQTPTLTQWGLIILVALIVFSTWVVLRRRRAVVSRQ